MQLKHGGADKFLGVRRILAQISTNLPEKESKENDFHKKRLHFTGRIVFQSEAVQAPCLPKFHQNFPKFPFNCPKITKLMHDFQKKQFWVPFL